MERFKTVVMLNGCVFFLMMGIGATVALLPAKVLCLSGSFMEVGLLASAFALPFVVFQLPVGWFADRYGFRWFLAAGYACCCLAGLLYAFAGTPALILTGRLLQGMGEVPVWALAPAMLSALYEDGRGTATGVYNASIHLGLTAGAVLGIAVPEASGGTGAFALLFLGGFCGALVTGMCIQEPRQAPVLKNSQGSILFLVTQYRVGGILMGVVLYGWGYGLFLTLIPAVMLPAQGPEAISVSVFFVLFYVAVGLSQILGGRLSDGIGSLRTMLHGILLAAVGMLLASVLTHIWVYVFLALAAFGLGIFCVASMVFLGTSLPTDLKGTVSATFYLFWGLGFFAGPILSGKLADSGHFYMGIRCFAALLALEAVWVGSFRFWPSRSGEPVTDFLRE